MKLDNFLEKYSIYLLLLGLWCMASLTTQAQNRVLTTQAEVDNFERTLGGSTVFAGDLTIGERSNTSSAITDLSRLNFLTEIGGYFEIRRNSGLEDMGNFSNLRKIGGRFLIFGNEALKTVSGFSVLDTLGGAFHIIENDRLTDLGDYPSLRYIGGDFIIGDRDGDEDRLNGVLTDVGDFPVLTTLLGNFNIYKSNQVNAFNGFPSLNTLGGYFEITGNERLEDLGNYAPLRHIGGYFSITGNDNLLDLYDFPALTSIGTGSPYVPSADQTIPNTSIVIENNPKLASCCVLRKFRSGGIYALSGIHVTNNATGCDSAAQATCAPVNLTTQAAVNDFRNTLGNATAIVSSLIIGPSSNITNLSPLDFLTEVTGSFEIKRNSALRHIGDFPNLRRIEGAYLLDDNDVLETVSGFSVLNSLRGDFHIIDNAKLNSLGNYDSLRYIGDDFFIGDGYGTGRINPSLVDLGSFPQLRTIGGDYQVFDSDSLVSIVGNFPSLERILGGLAIAGNEKLENVDMSSSLQFVGGNFIIGEVSFGNPVKDDPNPSLVSLNFSSLDTIKANFGIRDNDALVDGLDFSSLTTVTRNFSLVNNSSLKSTGSFSQLRTVGADFEIKNNPSLGYCCSLSSFLSDSNAVSMTITITNNALGCNSEGEINCNISSRLLSDTISVPFASTSTSSVLYSPTRWKLSRLGTADWLTGLSLGGGSTSVPNDLIGEGTAFINLSYTQNDISAESRTIRLLISSINESGTVLDSPVPDTLTLIQAKNPSTLKSFPSEVNVQHLAGSEELSIISDQRWRLRKSDPSTNWITMLSYETTSVTDNLVVDQSTIALPLISVMITYDETPIAVSRSAALTLVAIDNEDNERDFPPPVTITITQAGYPPHTETLTLTTQEQVDSIRTTLGISTAIEANLIIGSSENITDLSPLNFLTEVGGDIIIQENSILDRLADFDSLRRVGGGLDIKNNPSLTYTGKFPVLKSIGGRYLLDNNDALLVAEGFPVLDTLDKILIINNTNLDSLGEYNSLRHIKTHYIIGDGEGIGRPNPSLVDLGLFPQLRTIGGHYQVFNSDSLVNIVDNFPSLERIENGFEIAGNEKLETIDFSSSLQFVGSNFIMGEVSYGGHREISANPSLISLDFSSLERIEGDFEIRDNDALVDEIDFSLLTTITGNFSLVNNASLEEIGLFPKLNIIKGHYQVLNNDSLVNIVNNPSLERIEGNFEIAGNENLATIDFSSSLQFVGNNFIIGEAVYAGQPFTLNPSLVSLDFSSLERIEGDFKIKNNDALVDEIDFSSLTTITGNFSLVNNASLKDIGLFPQLRTIGKGFEIQNNALLGYCCGLSSFLPGGSHAVSGTITIGNNALGCNNEEEVNCDISSRLLSDTLRVLPPSTDTTFILYSPTRWKLSRLDTEADWLTGLSLDGGTTSVTNDLTGEGTAFINLSYTQHLVIESRTVRLLISSIDESGTVLDSPVPDTLTLIQKGAVSTLELQSPVAVNVGDDNGSVELNLRSNLRWRLRKSDPSVDWITMLSDGTTNVTDSLLVDQSAIVLSEITTVTVTYDEVPTPLSRSATLTLAAVDNDNKELDFPPSVTITITQAGYMSDARNITLTTQAEVNAIRDRLGDPRNTIVGNLTIGGVFYSGSLYNDITNLDSLNFLTEIRGNFFIGNIGDGNPNLINIGDFPVLRKIGGNYRVIENPKLVDGGRFPVLDSIGGYFSVRNNEKLTSVGSYPSLVDIGGYFSMNSNDNLRYLYDFPALMTIRGRGAHVPSNPFVHNAKIVIEQNSSLEYCCVLTKFRSEETDQEVLRSRGIYLSGNATGCTEIKGACDPFADLSVEDTIRSPFDTTETTFTITSNARWRLNKPSADADWVTMLSAGAKNHSDSVMAGQNDEITHTSVTVSYRPNSTYEPRTVNLLVSFLDEIDVASQKDTLLTLIQEAKKDILQLQSPNEVKVSHSNGSTEISILSNVRWQLRKPQDAAWITNLSTGSNNDADSLLVDQNAIVLPEVTTVTVTYDGAPTSLSRSAELVLVAVDENGHVIETLPPVTITITQAGFLSYTGDITLTTQAEVNAIRDTLGDLRISAIKGNLTIGLSSNITHLDSLYFLTEITGDFFIGNTNKGNAALVDIGNFPFLQKIGGNYYVTENPELVHGGNFPVLDSIGGYLFIQGNDKLEHVGYFPSLTNIGLGSVRVPSQNRDRSNTSIVIEQNPLLKYCCVLTEFHSGGMYPVSGDVYLSGNASGCNTIDEANCDLSVELSSDTLRVPFYSTDTAFFISSNTRWRLSKQGTGAEWVTMLSAGGEISQDSVMGGSLLAGSHTPVRVNYQHNTTSSVREVGLFVSFLDETDVATPADTLTIIQEGRRELLQLESSDSVNVSYVAGSAEIRLRSNVRWQLRKPSEATWITSLSTENNSDTDTLKVDDSGVPIARMTAVTITYDTIPTSASRSTTLALVAIDEEGTALSFPPPVTIAVTQSGIPVYPRSVTLRTQADVNDIRTRLGGAPIIGDKLTIGPSNDITNLDSLNFLIEVRGNFEFRQNSALTHTGDLPNLRKIRGEYLLFDNDALETVNGFSVLDSLGGNFRIIDNAELVDLGNYSSLRHINGNFIIGELSGRPNPSLVDLGDFSSLTIIGGSYIISGNGSLEVISGFPSLDSLGGNFRIIDNSELVDLGDYGSLRHINGSFIIGEPSNSGRPNPSLVDLGDFSSLTIIGGYYQIYDNDRLVHGGDFSMLDSIGSYFFVVANEKLTDVGFFPNLRAIGGYLSIRSQDNLRSLYEFPSLTNIGSGSAWVPSARQTRPNTSMVVENNSQLEYCCVLTRLHAGGGLTLSGDRYISNNFEGCNSIEMSSCDLSVRLSVEDTIILPFYAMDTTFTIHSNARWRLSKLNPEDAGWITSLSSGEERNSDSLALDRDATITVHYEQHISNESRTVRFILSFIDEMGHVLTSSIPDPDTLTFIQNGYMTILELSPVHASYRGGDVDLRIRSNKRWRLRKSDPTIHWITMLSSEDTTVSDSITGGVDDFFHSDVMVTVSYQEIPNANSRFTELVLMAFDEDSTELFIPFTQLGYPAYMSDLTLTTQIAVDTIRKTLGNDPKVTSIGGNLTIGPSDDITNLDSLHFLTEITGDFNIGNTNESNSALVDIGDFPFLQKIGGGYYVTENTELVHGGNFPVLDSIGGYFFIRINGKLESLGTFPHLKAIGSYISIRSNERLRSLYEFPALTSIGMGSAWVPSMSLIDRALVDSVSIVIEQNSLLEYCCVLTEFRSGSGFSISGDSYINNNFEGCNIKEGNDETNCDLSVRLSVGGTLMLPFYTEDTTFTIFSNTHWQLRKLDDVNWITSLSSDGESNSNVLTGEKDAPVTINYHPNRVSASRTANFLISFVDETTGAVLVSPTPDTLTFIQQGVEPTIQLLSDTIKISYSDGSANFTIFSNTRWQLRKSNPAVDWVTMLSAEGISVSDSLAGGNSALFPSDVVVTINYQETVNSDTRFTHLVLVSLDEEGMERASSLITIIQEGFPSHISDVTLTTQAEVNGFHTTLGNSKVTAVTGNLTIGPSSDITHLDSLRFLTEIGGNFEIRQDSGLMHIGDFPNLRRIGGNYVIFDNDILEIVRGLSALDSLGGNFHIIDNESLDSLGYYGSLRRIAGDFIIGDDFNLGRPNPSLKDLGNFSMLENIGGNYQVYYNDSLVNLVDNFPLLERVEKNFQIARNMKLANISAFTSLRNIGGNFQIGGDTTLESNPELVVLDFSTLSIVDDTFEIINNDMLVNAGDFSMLETIGGNVLISDNERLKNLDQFTFLKMVNGNFVLSSNDSLTSLNFSVLDTIKGHLQIHNNNFLDDMSFSTLKHIGKHISITDNENLLFLGRFPDLNYIGSSPSLYVPSESDDISDVSILVENNPKLFNCCLLDSFLLEESNEVTGDIYISNNFLGCNSVDETSCDQFVLVTTQTEVDSLINTIGNGFRLGHVFILEAEGTNDPIINLSVFNEIIEITGNLVVSGTTGLSALSQEKSDGSYEGFSSLQIIGGNLVVGNENDITDLDSLGIFPFLSNIKGDLILQNTSLNVIGNFSSLLDIGGDFLIDDNTSLKEIGNFSSLTEIKGDFAVLGNGSLDELAQIESTYTTFASLEEIRGHFKVNNNYKESPSTGTTGMSSIGTFPSLHLIGNDFIVMNNQSLKRLGDFGLLNYVVGDLVVNSNPLLDECCGLPTRVIGRARSISFSNNASGCTSLTQSGIASFRGSASTCFVGNLVLKNQSDVDAVPSTLTTIRGGIIIAPELDGDAIENLDALSNIKDVAFLEIKNTKRLQSLVRSVVNGTHSSLRGLSSLEVIRGNFSIVSNEGLHSLGDFSSLERVGGSFFVRNNDNLNDLGDFIALKDIFLIFNIHSNTSLISVGNFSALSHIGGNLIITNNDELLDLGNLSSLTSVGTQSGVYVQSEDNGTSDGFLDDVSIVIENNPQLFVCCGLHNLLPPAGTHSVKGSVHIKHNATGCNYSLALPSDKVLSNFGDFGDGCATIVLESQSEVNAFPSSMTEVLNLVIGPSSGLDAIKDLTPLNKLTGVNRHLLIRDNKMLNSIDGLGQLLEIGGNFSIQDNPSLYSLIGLFSLNGIGGEFQILRNDALYSLSGISLLDSILGSFYVRNNASLVTLENFSDLHKIGGSFYVDNNPSLRGFGESNSEKIGGFYYVVNNPLLRSLGYYPMLTSIGSSGDDFVYVPSMDNGLQDGYRKNVSVVIEDNNSLSNCCVLTNFLSNTSHTVDGSIYLTNNLEICNDKNNVNCPDLLEATIINPIAGNSITTPISIIANGKWALIKTRMGADWVGFSPEGVINNISDTIRGNRDSTVMIMHSVNNGSAQRDATLTLYPVNDQDMIVAIPLAVTLTLQQDFVRTLSITGGEDTLKSSSKIETIDIESNTSWRILLSGKFIDSLQFFPPRNAPIMSVFPQEELIVFEGDRSGRLVIFYQKNTRDIPRSGMLRIVVFEEGKEFINPEPIELMLIQEAAPTLSLFGKDINIGRDGAYVLNTNDKARNNVNITVNIGGSAMGWKVEVTSAEEQFANNMDPKSNTLSFNLSANMSGVSRTNTLTFFTEGSGQEVSQILNIVQQPQNIEPPTLTISGEGIIPPQIGSFVHTLSVNAVQQSYDITVDMGGSVTGWEVINTMGDFVTLPTESMYLEDSTITITIAANDMISSRKATLTFIATGSGSTEFTQTLEITQIAISPSISISNQDITCLNDTCKVSVGRLRTELEVKIDISNSAAGWRIVKNAENIDFVTLPSVTMGKQGVTVTLRISSNFTVSDRRATFTFMTANDSDIDPDSVILEINQPAGVSKLSLTYPQYTSDDGILNVNYHSQQIKVAVKVEGSTNHWIATKDNVDYLDLSPSGLSEEDTLTIMLQENTGVDREAIIEFMIGIGSLKKTLKIVQAGAPPKLTLSQPSATVDQEETPITIMFNVDGGATGWTSSIEYSSVETNFITLNSLQNLTQRGDITITATPTVNTGAERMATIILTTVGGTGEAVSRSFTVTQKPASPVLELITSDPITIDYNAITPIPITFDVKGTATGWTSSISYDDPENADFVELSPLENPNRTGEITITAEPTKNEEVERTATITLTTVGGIGIPMSQSISIVQKGALPTLLISSMDTTIAYDATDIPIKFNVGGGATGWAHGIEYSPTEADFITFNPQLRQRGETMLTVISKINARTKRTATITLTTVGGTGPPVSQLFTITQKSAPPAITLLTSNVTIDYNEINTIPIEFNVGGGATGWTSRIVYTPSNSDSFITLSQDGSSGTDTIMITATPGVNRGAKRTATITLTTEGGTGTPVSQLFTITQNDDVESTIRLIDPQDNENIAIPYSSTEPIPIEFNVDGAKGWQGSIVYSPSNAGNFITFSQNGSSETGNIMITATPEANSAAKRTATVTLNTIGGRNTAVKSFTITQGALPPPPSLTLIVPSTNNVKIPNDATSSTNIRFNVGGSATGWRNSVTYTPENANFITLSILSNNTQTGEVILTATPTAPNIGKERKARIAITTQGGIGGDASFTITITQAEGIRPLGVSASKPLTLYPNPMESTLTIEGISEDLQIYLHDLVGKEVFTSLLSPSKTTIDLSHLPSGMYMVTLENDKKRITELLIKK